MLSQGIRERLGCSDTIGGIGGFTGPVVHERSGLLESVVWVMGMMVVLALPATTSESGVVALSLVARVRRQPWNCGT